jgi:hypothetical protein
MSTEKLVATLRQIQALVNEALNAAPSDGSRKRMPRKSAHAKPATQISFDMSVLAFMNKYARGLSGPKKFTLLVARMVKGSSTSQVPFQEIRAQWNKMTTVLGGDFNPAHGNRAKAAGWVDSEKGRWKLTGSWKDALV